MGYLLIAAISFAAGRIFYSKKLLTQYKKEQYLREYIEILENREQSFTDGY